MVLDKVRRLVAIALLHGVDELIAVRSRADVLCGDRCRAQRKDCCRNSDIQRLHALSPLDSPLDWASLAEQGSTSNERPHAILGETARLAQPRRMGSPVRRVRALLRAQARG